MIVCPGGGYGALAMNHEGRQVANWFNALGVTAFVLKYRLGPRYHHPIEFGDAQRAIQHGSQRRQRNSVSRPTVSASWVSQPEGILPPRPPRISIAGTRPTSSILGYPVSLHGALHPQGSAKNLLGDNPDPKLLEELSNELRVTPQTPPTFLFHTSADTGVPAENSVAFYLALHKAGVPAEMHIFEKGPHGVGLDLADPALGEWPTLLANWLRGRGLLK